MHEQHGQPKRRRVLPPDIAGANLKLWLRSDLGVTLVADPVIGAWTLAAGWTAAGGGVYSHAGAADNLSQAILVVGNAYRVTYTVSGVSGGTIRPYAGTTAGTSRAADGTYTEVLVCAGNTSMIFVGNGTASVGAISIESLSVSGWADQSGNGNDVVQATATKQPVYYSSGGPADQPYLWFDGVDDYLRVLFTLVQPEHFFLVAMPSRSKSNNTAIFDGSASSAAFAFTSGVNRVGMYAGAQLTSPIGGAVNNDTWQRLEFLNNGAASRVGVNGVAATGNVGANNAGGVILGMRGSTTSNPGDCNIVEFCVWNSVLTAPQLVLLNEWLGARYSI